MSRRSSALTMGVLALALILVPGAPAKRPPPPPNDRTPPTTPTNLQITASGPTSISLAWNASTDKSGFWYIVEGCGGSIRVDPPQTTFTNSRLTPSHTYSCFVYAVDAAGNRSGNSNTVTYTTPADTTPPTAPTLSADAVWPTRVAVSWTLSGDNSGGQVWYTLLVNGSPYIADQIGYRATTVLYLSPSTSYTFKVTVRDAAGNTAESNAVSLTTPAATESVPPSAPTNLRLAPQSSAPEAWLNWDQSIDNSDPQSQILYEVFVNGERADEATTIGYPSTIAYCRSEGPATIVVRATDTSGNVSVASNELSFSC
jgi:chitodextrinase